ncbi:MAG: bifunctional fucokinase/L-fucose-1-P-guanylyltransferase [Oligosphaeraceae bacterium]|nr:bifunctional fucokinase/L-fucose-1-P-guanylyltransferase [Oligosphaeraceae bacterium]
MINTHKLAQLFLQQSSADAWEEYRLTLAGLRPVVWDFIVLTAANEEQAQFYRRHLSERQEKGYLPRNSRCLVLADPAGQRVGSGGATLNVLEEVRSRCGSLAGLRLLVIHSGGDSKRIPQYSACGKLFSPVLRQLPDGRNSTLFDELLIAMSGVAARCQPGMLVLSGDVLLLFNPLQLDLQLDDAVAVSCQKDAATGQHHGVFLDDGHGGVKAFLHKIPLPQLHRLGAVDEWGNVDIDTGAIFLSRAVLEALLSLISRQGQTDPARRAAVINSEVRLSFYGDFLYPLAKDSSAAQFQQEKAEGSLNAALQACRQELWAVLRPFRLRLLRLSPAEFVHFGTTPELLSLASGGVDDYEFLHWQRQVGCFGLTSPGGSAYNTLALGKCQLPPDCYLEDCIVAENCTLPANSLFANLNLPDRKYPGGIVMHGLQLRSGKCCVRIYGLNDDSKTLKSYLGCQLGQFAAPESLWETALFPECPDWETGIQAALQIYQTVQEKKKTLSQDCPYSLTAELQLEQLFPGRRLHSLASSLAECDYQALWENQAKLRQYILKARLREIIQQGQGLEKILPCLPPDVPADFLSAWPEELLGGWTSGGRMRLLYCLSRAPLPPERQKAFAAQAFDCIRREICQACLPPPPPALQFATTEETVELPLRVNWGGGWTDTPPYCCEQGGVVLNAAIKLQGQYPIRVTARRLPQLQIELASADAGHYGTFTDLAALQDCGNPFDPFALHKAALLSLGIIPRQGGPALKELLRQMGGGLSLSTQVMNVPRGSGLGTSSILAAGSLLAVGRLFGLRHTSAEISNLTLCLEQIMSTGGGWQDQLGGLLPGIKLIRTTPGWQPEYAVQTLRLSANTRRNLQERFVLISTGQRRLARNLLREIVGKYLTNDRNTLETLRDIRTLPEKMGAALQRGNLDYFAHLLSQQWELNQRLDPGCSNTCIEFILNACQDLLEGQFIAGAGGGGFLQVILKKGVSRKNLATRLRKYFPENVAVWESQFTDQGDISPE